MTAQFSKGDRVEDATEPEPLKEGTPVLVWAVVERHEIDSDGEILLQMHGDGGGNGYAYTRPDAIIRPADGATPPWIKQISPAEALYNERGWSGCAGSAWENLPSGARRGWEVAAEYAARIPGGDAS